MCGIVIFNRSYTGNYTSNFSSEIEFQEIFFQQTSEYDERKSESIKISEIAEFLQKQRKKAYLTPFLSITIRKSGVLRIVRYIPCVLNSRYSPKYFPYNSS